MGEDKLPEKMTKEHIEKIVSRYYDVSSVTESGDTISVRTTNLDLAPEENFDRMIRDLESSGYVAFTDRNLSDEIEIIRIPDTNKRNWIKLIMAAATLGSIIYYGYIYQSSYSGSSSIASNVFSSLIFFLTPMLVILASREVGKYVALKKNGMSYSFPILIPDPLGIGTMGLINGPSKPFSSRRSMIEAGSYSLIMGFVISLIFYILGSILTVYFPPSLPVVNSPIQKVGSPLLLQFISFGIIPSNGILDPLALAGWAGIVITAFNALPLGFLDGGLIASAIVGRRVIYLSYLSVFVILGLSILYPPWIVLLVFALLVGLRGPQALNNRFNLRPNAKVLSAIALVIIVVGIAPLPFHTSLNSFNISVSQQSFVVYGTNTTLDLSINVSNTGGSLLVPAFEVSPVVSFTLSGRSKSLGPGQSSNYSMQLDTQGTLNPGFNHFTIYVYSGDVERLFDLTVLSVRLSQAFLFDGQNPLTKDVQENKQFNMTLRVDLSHETNLTIVSMVEPVLNYTYFFTPNPNSTFMFQATSNVVFVLPSTAQVGQGTPIQLSFLMPHIPAWWAVVAYNDTYNGSVAFINVA